MPCPSVRALQTHTGRALGNSVKWWFWQKYGQQSGLPQHVCIESAIYFFGRYISTYMNLFTYLQFIYVQLCTFIYISCPFFLFQVFFSSVGSSYLGSEVSICVFSAETAERYLGKLWAPSNSGLIHLRWTPMFPEVTWQMPFLKLAKSTMRAATKRSSGMNRKILTKMKPPSDLPLRAVKNNQKYAAGREGRVDLLCRWASPDRESGEERRRGHRRHFLHRRRPAGRSHKEPQSPWQDHLRYGFSRLEERFSDWIESVWEGTRVQRSESAPLHVRWGDRFRPHAPLWGCHSTKRLSAASRPLAQVTNPNSGASSRGAWMPHRAFRVLPHEAPQVQGTRLPPPAQPFFWKACSWCSWSEWDSWDHRWKLHPRPCQERIQEHSRYDDPPMKDEFREPSRRACGLILFYLCLIDYMPVFVVKHCLNGRILGYTLRNLPFVKGVVPLVLLVICRLISLHDINRMGASLAFSLTLLNVSTLSLIQLSGLLFSTTAVIQPLLTCYLTCTILFHVVFDTQDASVPFGMLPMVYFKVTV